MDASVARERITSVIKPDSITSSQGDFLATHVAVGGLELLNKFEFMPPNSRRYSESEVYESLVLNPDNRHQFVAVYGQSGTGKSHLIRWFEAKFRNDKLGNEVVLFIRRSDNTLKGTIRQLLSTPEVQAIANREAYERLVKATTFEDESKLKGRIYYDFVNEVECDEGTHGIALPNTRRKRLVAFLQNDRVKEHLMSSDGPIERIYSRIAENSNVDRDTIAQFEVEDFVISPDLCGEMYSSADPKAIREARALMADDSRSEEAKKIVDYLNQFVNDVVQRSAGIQPGDFRDIFQDIRRGLAQIGKSLTLFIEDVTSFTGVDDALLDALLVDHDSDTSLCRVSSFVGTTNNYLQHNFKDNHKDRITRYVYIPSGLFEEEKLFEFVARYLNAMSLRSETIDKWVEGHAHESEYPVHEVREGANWEYVEVNGGKYLCLYPFTRHSIRFFYEHVLTDGQQTPRYIIRDIIEPVVNDILYNKESFPSDSGLSISFDQRLAYRINTELENKRQADRLLRFLTIWGDGSVYQKKVDRVTYYSSIREDILSDLGFPDFTLLKKEASNQQPQKPPVNTKTQEEKNPTPESSSKRQVVPNDVRDKVDKAMTALSEWAGGKPIDVSSTGGTQGVLNNALRDLNLFVETAINWQAEGISIDNIKKIRDSKRKFVSLDNQPRQQREGFYVLPAKMDSWAIVSAFVRWRHYGKKSWNYEDADFDVFVVTSWVQSIKDNLVSAVNDEKDTGVSYIQAALCSEAYRMILLGGYKGDTLKSFGIDDLYKDMQTTIGSTFHCEEWTSLVALLSQKNDDHMNTETVREYFNLQQGTGISVTVLDYPRFSKALSEAKSHDLTLPGETLKHKDSVVPRDRVFQYYAKIEQRIGQVAEAEAKKARELLAIIDRYLYDEEYGIDEDAILDFVEAAKKFYSEASKSKMSVAFCSVDQIKKNATRISSAIKRTRQALEKDAPLDIILVFSTDPLCYLVLLSEFLKRLQNDLNKAEVWLDTQERQLRTTAGLAASTELYQNESTSVDECIALLNGGAEYDR